VLLPSNSLQSKKQLLLLLLLLLLLVQLTLKKAVSGKETPCY